MRTLAAIGSSSGATVPFWLQVLTVALAPIIGFAGVAVGVLLKSHSDQRLALREDRKVLYMEFLAALRELHYEFGTRGATAFRTKNADKITAVMGRIQDTTGRLLVLSMQIDLIGSYATASIVHNYVPSIADVNLAFGAAISKGFDRSHWAKALSNISSFTDKFRDAASRDLGISSRERNRHPDAALIDNLKDVITKVDEFEKRVAEEAGDGLTGG